MFELSHKSLPKFCLPTIYYSFVPYLINCIEFWGNAAGIYLNPVHISHKQFIYIIAGVPL